jgi:hypothetical protein
MTSFMGTLPLQYEIPFRLVALQDTVEVGEKHEIEIRNG